MFRKPPLPTWSSFYYFFIVFEDKVSRKLLSCLILFVFRLWVDAIQFMQSFRENLPLGKIEIIKKFENLDNLKISLFLETLSNEYELEESQECN